MNTPSETIIIPHKVAPWLQKLPNRLTFLRIFCIPIVVYLMIQAQTLKSAQYLFIKSPSIPSLSDILAAIIFVIAALTDFFDGLIARKLHLESMLGKLLDPLADKLLIVSALIILVEKHRLAGWIAVIFIVRDLGINAIRIAALDDGININSNMLGKLKTTLLDIGIIGLIIYGYIGPIPFHYLGNLCIIIALAVSIFSAMQYLFAYGKKLKQNI